jgi:hypothetical protein
VVSHILQTGGWRDSTANCGIDHPDRAERLNSFGNELGRQYERMGEIKDLGEAMRMTSLRAGM